MSNILKQDGYNIIEASDGIEAVKMYKENKPDAVLLDITMPKKDGFDVLKEIKENDKNAKVIIFSAMGQKNVIDKAYKEGAVDFIIKPSQTSRISEAVRKVVE